MKISALTCCIAAGWFSFTAQAQTPPVITVHPTPQTTPPGGSVTFAVAASGASAYQWTRNGVAVAGATNATLLVSNAQLAQAGRYAVNVSNANGSVVSAPAELRLSGTLWGMGDDQYGRLGLASASTRTVAIAIAARVKAVASGNQHSVFLNSDGTLWGMGRNTEGQLGDGTTTSRSTPVQMATGVAGLAAGGYHSLYLKTDGTLWAMGRNTEGQLGDGTTTSRSTPVQVATGVAGLAAGGYHSLYLKTDGTLWAMGANYRDQLGDGTTTNRSTPVLVADAVAGLAAGGDHSLYLKVDGTLWAMGSNVTGQLGDSSTTGRSVPVQVATGVAGLAAADRHSLYLRTDGTLWAMGHNAYGQLGDGTTMDRSTPVQVASGVAGLAAGANHSLYLKADGTLWAMGDNYSGQLGDGTTANRTVPVQVATAVAGLAAGADHSLYLKTDGTLWAMGFDSVGQLGHGTTANRATPLQVATGVADLAAGGSHSLYLQNEGTLWAMGLNYNGQLGIGTTASQTAPVKVTTGVAGLAAGGSHSLYLKTDGTLWAMGANSSGQLGDGTTTYRSTPVQVATGVAGLAAGTAHSLYLKTDGTLWAMGWNSYGQLGDGTTTSRSTPVQVAAGVADLAAGGRFTLYLKTDGTLWAMGANSSGQLGDGTTKSRATPLQVATGVASLAAGSSHSLYLKTDGTLWAMGDNSSGQIGDGTTTNRTVSVQVDAGVASLTAGGSHSLYVKTDGMLWAIGGNSFGQLGDGTNINRLYPLRIALDVLGVGGNGGTSFFIQAEGVGTPPFVSVHPPLTQPSLGDRISLTASASGSGPLDYVWQKNGVEIPGARSATFYLPCFLASDVGTYTVTVRNSAGSVTSNAAALTLAVPAAVTSSLLNGAVRSAAGNGANTLLGSFTIEGSIAKQMLIRAVGPTLGTLGVSGALADPRLEVVHAGTGLVVAANDDWGLAANAAQVAALTAQVGAFPLSAGSKDAVVVGAFGPGAYRVQVRGADAASGDCLLEIYDVDTTPRLVHLATRAPAGGAAGVLIQGFVARNLPPGRSYLIRALGPSLGLAGSLADPVFTLYGGAGALGTNDNWAGDAGVAEAATMVGAMPLAATSKDAALVFTPPAAGGAYTVQVSGVGSASGIALLEIFEVDAQRASTAAPAVISPPESAALATGQALTLGVVTTGKPVPSFQWRKDGAPLTGATTSRFNVASVSAADAGGYDVAVTNSVGTVFSPVANVTISGGHSATQAQVGSGYVAGSTVTLTNTLTYTGTASSLGWQVTLPAGWSFASDGGSGGDVKPATGATETLEWAWTTVPASPVTFTYTVNVPAGETVARSLTAAGIVRSGGTVATVAATPSPVTIAPIVTHSGDSNRDFRFGLLELTRVIELYNTRNGTVRTGCYAVATTPTEDGFVADPARAGSASVTLSRYHSGDSGRDGKISLLELTRVIELYNYRAGTTRTGQYHVQAGTEDGYAPGP